MRRTTGLAREFRLFGAAPWLAVATLLGCAGALHEARHDVVVPYPDATNAVEVDPAVCQRVCPAAVAREHLEGCHATSAEAVRRVMSDGIRNTHLVCTYAGEGAR